VEWQTKPVHRTVLETRTLA